MHRISGKSFATQRVFCALLLLFLSRSLFGQETDAPITLTQKYLVVPKTLTAENVPPVPETYPARWSKYLAGYYVTQSLAGWDAAKREILLKEYGAEGWQISRLAAPQDKPTKLFKLPKEFYDLYWQPGGKFLAYTKDTDGDGQWQLNLLDPSNGESHQLTDGKSRNVEPVWSKDGKQMAFGSTPTGREGMELYTVAPFAKPPYSLQQFASSKTNPLQAYDWSPANTQIVYLEYLANRSNNKLWLADLTTGTNTLLTTKTDAEQTVFDNPHFSSNGQGLYLLTNLSSEFRRLAYFDLKTRRFTFLSSQVKWDVEEYALAPDGQTIAFVTNEDGISQLYLLHTKTNKITVAKWSTVGLIAPQINEPAAHLHWQSNSLDVAFDVAAPRTPNDVYSLNAKSGEFTHWSSSGDGGGLPLKDFTEPRLIQWPSFDKLKISGWLYQPPARFAGPRPVIIDLHGGPEEQFRPQFSGDTEFTLQELGVAVIYPNVRGSAGYGSNFVSLDDGLKRADATRDVGALLDWIAAQPNFDAQRIMVRGDSYGGYLALSVAATYGSRVRAVLSDSGPTNLATYLENTAGWRRDLRRREYGDERDPKVRAFLEKIAPRNNTAQIKAAALIVQGANDPRVNASEAQSLVAAMRNNGTPVWYLLGKNEGHGFSDPQNSLFSLYAFTLFVEAFLLK